MDDILVFGDKYFIEHNKYNVKVIEIGKQDYHPIFTRIFCSDKIDISKYDQIMYLDSDIEVLNNIYSMFNAKDKLLYAVEWNTFIGMFPPKHECTSSCFTDREFIIYSNNNVVNSGTYCVDSKLFTKFMDTWKDLINKFPVKWGTDQSTLNLMVYKDLIECDYWEEGIIHFPEQKYWRSTKTTGSEILCHYISDDKKEVMLTKYANI